MCAWCSTCIQASDNQEYLLKRKGLQIASIMRSVYTGIRSDGVLFEKKKRLPVTVLVQYMRAGIRLCGTSASGEGCSNGAVHVYRHQITWGICSRGRELSKLRQRRPTCHSCLTLARWSDALSRRWGGGASASACRLLSKCR